MHKAFRHLRTLLVAVPAVLMLSASLMPAGAAPDPENDDFYGFQGEVRPAVFEDFDSRSGSVAPTAAQEQRAMALGATGVRWNRFGTPHSLINHGGFLATGLPSDPEQAARRFVADNAALFKLSSAGPANLELLRVSPLGEDGGHVVLFRQRFGTLPAAQDGLLTVGVKDGQVAYVSSSVVGNGNTPAAATLSPAEAYRFAAADVNRPVDLSAITVTGEEDDWTMLEVTGFELPQRARLRAFATLTSRGVTVVPVYETIVLSNDHGDGHPMAFTHFVDARGGRILWRQNRVSHFGEAGAAGALAQVGLPSGGTFSGTTNPDSTGDCGPDHPFVVPPGTQSIGLTATATSNPNPDTGTGDITLSLVGPDGMAIVTEDVLGSPEVLVYSPGGEIPTGTYAARVCNFNADDPGIDYEGTFSTSPVGAGDAELFPFPPRWTVFPANPPLPGTGANPRPEAQASVDTRELWCWTTEDADGNPVPECDRDVSNTASRFPWDVNTRTGLPTFTTIGNNAVTGEARLSPLTPAEQYRPTALDRDYTYPWDNEWFEEKCNPATLAVPGTGADIDAATANLFAMHNRMHDWSFHLGFTERNSNLQDNNFGNTRPGAFPAGRELDPEVGNSQAGATTGGQPTFLGRDNANQITLNDGIAPITNMYLWQPIAGAFYPPCVDGDYDMSVIAHEYGHAIQNRMTGGPDAQLSGAQARAMGESWSDLTAIEYLNGFGFVPVENENPFSVGAYVTGDLQAGIRNYGMNSSPLNYSNVGYDITGPQVHADGEIWSATNFRIRQRLVAKYNALGFPASDQTRQTRCADGEIPADLCPGNRRWVQIFHDAFLLQPSATSMVDSRDAYLAADRMRFNGANQVELWDEFARSGLGEFAASTSTNDPDPRPSFESPLRGDEATVVFDPIGTSASGQPRPQDVSLYVGRFEARSNPIADTDSSTTLGNTFKLVPGTYDFVAQADGFGLTRLRATVTAGQQLTLRPRLAENVGSLFRGASAGGDGVNRDFLIDDTEGTNWASLRPRGTAPVNETQPQVTVSLAGPSRDRQGEDAGTVAHTVRRVNVSAMLRTPNDQCSPNQPECDPQDSGSQNRFSALRQFQILTCNAAAGQTCGPNGEGNFSVIYTSSPAAFPSIAPRPRSPELIFRTFNVPATAATHVQLRVVHNQCTGFGGYRGEQDNDPGNNTDCVTGSSIAGVTNLSQGTNVRAAELQVFSNRLRVSGLP